MENNKLRTPSLNSLIVLASSLFKDVVHPCLFLDFAKFRTKRAVSPLQYSIITIS